MVLTYWVECTRMVSRWERISGRIAGANRGRTAGVALRRGDCPIGRAARPKNHRGSAEEEAVDVGGSETTAQRKPVQSAIGGTIAKGNNDDAGLGRRTTAHGNARTPDAFAVLAAPLGKMIVHKYVNTIDRPLIRIELVC
jgi:hypothetical protein